ncbi:MAG: DUF2255 family protein [Streptosporangiaceae bacterium]
MSTWTSQELDTLGESGELEISTRRDDGTLRQPVPIWVVRVGDDLYIRSWKGRGGGWFAHASGQSTARIRAGEVERDVLVAAPDASMRAAIDQAYRSKYTRYGGIYVDPMVADAAAEATLQLTPTTSRTSSKEID